MVTLRGPCWLSYILNTNQFSNLCDFVVKNCQQKPSSVMMGGRGQGAWFVDHVRRSSNFFAGERVGVR